MQVVENTAAALLAGCTANNINMFHERAESCTTLGPPNTDFAAVGKQVPDHTALQSDLDGAQHLSFRLEAR